MVLTASVSLSVPVWMAAARHLSKKAIWLCGAALTVLSQATLFLFPPGNASAFLGLIAIIGVGSAAFYVTFWSMLPDTVEYGEFRAGQRDEGLAFGINQLALKAATAVGIGILGLLLEVIGYMPNQPQAETTTQGLRMISMLLPIAGTALAALIISTYPIDKALHARLVRAIDWRNRRRVAPPLTSNLDGETTKGD